MIYEPNDWIEICKDVADVCHNIFPYIPKKAVRSTIVSSVFETQTERHFQIKGINLLGSRHDREPDLYCKDCDTKCEIKVTGLDSTIVNKTVTWLGGRYSKRNSDHIFIGWNYQGGNNLFDTRTMSFVVLKTYVTEDDWRELSNSKEYYGLGFKSHMFENKKIDMLVGNYQTNTFILRDFCKP